MYPHAPCWRDSVARISVLPACLPACVSIGRGSRQPAGDVLGADPELGRELRCEPSGEEPSTTPTTTLLWAELSAVAVSVAVHAGASASASAAAAATAGSSRQDLQAMPSIDRVRA